MKVYEDVYAHVVKYLVILEKKARKIMNNTFFKLFKLIFFVIYKRIFKKKKIIFLIFLIFLIFNILKNFFILLIVFLI